MTKLAQLGVKIFPPNPPYYLFPKNIEADATEGYTEFDGINDDWEEFNERDFEQKT